MTAQSNWPPAAQCPDEQATTRADFLRAVQPSARGTIERAFAGTASPRAAIKAKCMDCCGYDRAEITACAVVLCPLHAYRPFQNARNPSKNARGSEFLERTGSADPQIGP